MIDKEGRVMERSEQPTEGEILDWLRLYDAEGRNAAQDRAWSSALPRIARILWLRYCAEPPAGLEAIAGEYGFRAGHASALVQRGLALLARAEEQGGLPPTWGPEAPLGRAVIQWRLRNRRFVPRSRLSKALGTQHAPARPTAPLAGFSVPS
jgi:hypothetical protein